MSEAIIEIEQVVFSYVREEGGENIPALDGVDLEILEASWL